jgi:hypothetical protein
MRKLTSLGALLVVCLVSPAPKLLFAQAPPVRRPCSPAPISASTLPLSFVENRGQWDERVRFRARQRGMTVFFTQDAFVLDLEQETRGAAVFLSFESCSRAAVVEGITQLPGCFNYFRGGDPSRWRTGVRSYAAVGYRGLYPGVDLLVSEHDGRLEYDLHLEPGADLEHVVVRCAGADALRLGEDGSLVLTTAAGPVEQPKPTTYQIERTGARRPIDCSYRLLGEGRFGFEVVGRERDLPLVIDPGLVYSTFLGGSENELARAVALDDSGAAVVCGETESKNFPTKPGAYDRTFNGDEDAFVTKFDPAGSTLLYSTFLGGKKGDYAYALALDAAGNAVVTGATESSDFPTTHGAFDTKFNGGKNDVFVAKLDATGSALIYSTFLGGSDDGGAEDEQALALALDDRGDAFVSGYTYSADFPTTPGAYDRTLDGEYDSFVSKLDPTGSTLLYSTFLGGSNERDYVYGIGVDREGAAVVGGYTDAADFPTTPGAFDTRFSGASDAFVTKLDPAGRTLLYSTFLGGSADDAILALALDESGAAVIGGFTNSDDFPTTKGAYDRTHGEGSFDGFVTKLSATGSLVYSTFLGGAYIDQVNALALDASGAPVVAGITYSIDFPTTSDTQDDTYNGSYDAFVAKLDASGGKLLYSTFLGGSDGDYALAIALTPTGEAVVGGTTMSANFPTTPEAYDRSFKGGDAFVAKLQFCLASARTYGDGWRGTLGVPSLTSGPPILCTEITISLGNSRGAATPAAFLVGSRAAKEPTHWGGTLLVEPSYFVPFLLQADGGSFSYTAPCDEQYCGFPLYLQAIEQDPGATQGVSFTRGLELIHGR